jgi:hypothetical protein
MPVSLQLPNSQNLTRTVIQRGGLISQTALDYAGQRGLPENVGAATTSAPLRL